MIRKVSYESQERREKQVLAALNANGIKSLEEANQICEDAGVDPYQMCEDTQRICFENAKWAYVAGATVVVRRLFVFFFLSFCSTLGLLGLAGSGLFFSSMGTMK